MAAGANDNQLKAAAEKTAVHGGNGNSNSSMHNQQSIKSGSEEVVVAVVVAVKGHLVLDGSAVCHLENYFFIACILLQKKRGPLVDCCMES
jgi:hypothetical protein